MTERDQLVAVCRWNRRLSRENASLRVQVEQAAQGIRELEAAIARLQVEAEAADALLAAAMDEAAQARTE